MAVPQQRLTIFQDDDVTPLVGTVDGSGNVTDPTCSTDPAHARPYLLRIMEQAESEIDLIEGSSTIGQLNVEILDRRTVLGNQATGWFTAILGGASGFGTIIGRRILVEQQATSGSWYTLINGVAGDLELNDDYVTYKIPIRDIRERERDVPLFNQSDGSLSIFPPGPVNGYGRIQSIDFVYGTSISEPWLVKPVQGVKAKFVVDPLNSNVGLAMVTDLRGMRQDGDAFNRIQTISHAAPYFGAAITLTDSSKMTYRDVGVRWRVWNSGSAWNVIRHMPYFTGTAFSSWMSAFNHGIREYKGWFGSVSIEKGNPFIVMSTTNNSGATALPTTNTDIELQLIYFGVPTEELPMLIEKNLGQLLKDCYDGVYSTEAPRVLYDSTAMTAFIASTPLARVKVTKAEKNMRDWVEKNVYKPTGSAPAIAPNGKITPVRYTLPDSGTSLIQLDDTNICEGSWRHSYKDVVNKIVFKYIREVSQTGKPVEKFFFDIPVDERDVEYVEVNTSAALFGPHTVEYDPETFRAWSNLGNSYVSGNIVDEIGTQLAKARGKDILDRFSYGAQRFSVSVRRSATGMANLKVGDWIQIASSWMPDYTTGQRGINRIGQIVRIQDMDPATRALEIIDGGPFTTPLAQPTFSTLTNVGGRVGVQIDSIPTGGIARADYALTATGDAVPDVNSGKWVYAFATLATGTFYTPPVPKGVKVWVRVRTEMNYLTQVPRRPSTWVAATSINTPTDAGVYDVNVTLKDGSNPILTWTRESTCLGLRVYYQVYNSGSTPTSFSSFIDLDATLGSATLNIDVRQLQHLMVSVEPWSGFSAGAVSGSAGSVKMLATAQRISSEKYIQPLLLGVQSLSGNDTVLTLTPFDPQFRITLVEKKTKIGSAAESAYSTVSLSGGVYTVTATSSLDGEPTFITYRLTGINADGQTVVLEEYTYSFAKNRPLKTVRITGVTITSADEVINVQYEAHGYNLSLLKFFCLFWRTAPGNAWSVKDVPTTGATSSISIGSADHGYNIVDSGGTLRMFEGFIAMFEGDPFSHGTIVDCSWASAISPIVLAQFRSA